MTAAAPLFDIAEGPAGGTAHWLVTADGPRIRVAVWGHTAPKGTILLFPGRTEFIEKYGRAATDLLARGYATLCIDWRGQGLAARLQPDPALGHVADFVDYQQDVAAVMAFATAQNLPRPFYLLAHSMGGCIALRSLNAGLPVNAVCFTAPMWGIKLAAPLRPIAWALSGLSLPLGFSNSIAPGQTKKTYVLRAGFAGNDLTSDPDMFAYMQGQCQAHPELSLGGPSLRWLNAALRETLELSQGPAPATPCLTFLGTEEGIIDVPRIRQRMANWSNGTLVMVAGSRHEVMMETPAIRQQTFDQACAFFDRHGRG
jgi:lysophospholipase